MSMTSAYIYLVIVSLCHKWVFVKSKFLLQVSFYCIKVSQHTSVSAFHVCFSPQIVYGRPKHTETFGIFNACVFLTHRKFVLFRQGEFRVFFNSIFYSFSALMSSRTVFFYAYESIKVSEFSTHIYFFQSKLSCTASNAHTFRRHVKLLPNF